EVLTNEGHRVTAPPDEVCLSFLEDRFHRQAWPPALRALDQENRRRGRHSSPVPRPSSRSVCRRCPQRGSAWPCSSSCPERRGLRQSSERRSSCDRRCP